MPLVLNGTTGVQDNSGAFVAGTAVASTSGTSIDFTSIPSWVKRITLILNGVSLNSTATIRVLLGVSGTPETTGYSSFSGAITPVPSLVTLFSDTGVALYGADAGYLLSGNLVFTLVGSNTWIFSGVTSNTTVISFVQQTAGKKALAGTLNMLRITSSTGTDTFDAGTINILYE
jgi:hypothetical protein